MGLIEAILHRSAVALPEGDNNPLDAFLQIVNFGLEQTLGRDVFRELEPKRFIQALRNPACGELDEATRKRLDKKGITSSFWDRILVFSSHEECFLPGQLSFVFDKNKRLFVLSLGNVLMNAQDIQILCRPLERFDKQHIQAKFTVQQDGQKSIPTLNMLLGIDQISKRERALFIITRYRKGYPQISLSVLNLESNWKELFDDTGKLKAIPADIAQAVSQGPNFERPKPPLPLHAINNILREKGLIEANQQILPGGIFQPQVAYTPDGLQIPVFIVARPEEIDPTRIISVSNENCADSTKHNLQIALNGIFLRCHRESITVTPAIKERIAVLLTLNPKVFMSTPEGGFYRKEKGIIAIPFELSND